MSKEDTMEEKVVLSAQRYKEIQALVIKVAGDRLDQFESTFVARNGVTRQIKAEIVANHNVSYGEFRGYFEKFEEECMALISDEEWKKMSKIINSIDPGTHGGPMRVARFFRGGSTKLAAAGYSVRQIVGAYGRHWQMMSDLLDKKSG